MAKWQVCLSFALVLPVKIELPQRRCVSLPTRAILMESGFKIPLPTGDVCVFSRLPVVFVSRPQLGEIVHRPESETFDENRSELPGGDSLPS